MYKRLRFYIIALIIFAATSAASADTLGERHTFYVNPSYDATGRTSVPATLEYAGGHAYFYVEDSYLNSLSPFERRTLDQLIISTAQDFDTNIYSKETGFFGTEANPGIDNDPRLTILLERLTSGTGGYFDSVNEYAPDQAIHTNQREMIVASITSIGNNHVDTFLSHEFQHLISFNQKELIRNVSEETWLNELRSQYAITVAGYNDNFQNSDLYQRVLTFMQNPTDSLTEWPNTLTDYSSVTLLGHYLVDRFGPSVLKDTLQSSSTGIASFNAYLSTHVPGTRFSDIFADWVWANYLNNHSLNSKFGYANPNLQSIHIPPADNRMLTAVAANIFTYSLKPWQPVLYQFITDQSAQNKNIKISWGNPSFEVYFADNNGPRALHDGDVVPASSAGSSFALIPINVSKTESFGTTEIPIPFSVTITYTDQAPASLAATLLQDGALIKHADAPDIYVVTGPYKRLLPPQVLKFYGLDAANVITVPEAAFQSYMTTNYIRAVNEKKVYAVWPDGTKHWLNMTAQHFSDSHRDWNSVFIVNDLESKFYSIGPDITQ